MTDHWRRVDELFHEVMLRPPGERQAWLAAACEGDESLRQDVSSLVENAEAASGERFLEPVTRRVETLVGRQLGTYRVEALIGAGGMGEVYRAHDSKLKRNVALKLLPLHVLDSPARLQRFEREARAASALNHPNIVTIHEIGHADGLHFIVQELVDGRTLREGVAQQPVPVSETIDILLQVAGALAAAHAAGVVHRDIKPDNVMVRADGYVKVLDFGLAKLAASADLEASKPVIRGVQTETGLILGTTRYMSPEQARGLSVDARSDLFSLGVMAYEMLSGRAPFDGATSGDVIAAVLRTDPPALADRVHGLPAELDRIIGKLLRKDAGERYQTARDLIADLQSLRSDLQIASHSSARSARARPSRRRLAVAVAAIAVLAVAAVALFLPKTPVLTPQDAILLTDFSNTTGDAVFDGPMLKQGLAMQLRQTPFLTLVPDEAVRTALTLMTRSPDEPVTKQIGLEICQRQGLKALVTGSIARLGSRFVVTLEAIAAQSGDSLAIELAEADSHETVLRALSQSAIGLRRKLGESLTSLEAYNAPIERATTSSLDALKAYSTGLGHMFREDGRAAQPFFERAVVNDPQFVAAYDYGAWAFSFTNLRRAASFAELGYRHRARATERERLSAEATFHHFVTADLEEENRICEVWSGLYPNDWVPKACLAFNHLTTFGRFEEMERQAREILRISPDVAHGYRFLTPALLSQGRLDEARTTIESAQIRRLDNRFLRSDRLRIAVAQNDATALAQVLEDIRQVDGLGAAFLWEARVAAFSGRVRQARNLYDRGNGRGEAHQRDVLIGACDPAALQTTRVVSLERISSAGAFYGPLIGPDGSLCGPLDDAQSFVDALRSRFPGSTTIHKLYGPITLAAIALKRDQPDRALEALRANDPIAQGSRFWPQYLRGHALLRLGRGHDAAAEFRTIIDHRNWDTLSVFYPLAHIGLARAIELAGDTAAARQAYERFFLLWKDADADLPVLIDAQKRYRALAR